MQAKEAADDLIAEKSKVEAERAAAEKVASDARQALTVKAAGVGNLVGPKVPVSLTEVRL